MEYKGFGRIILKDLYNMETLEEVAIKSKSKRGDYFEGWPITRTESLKLGSLQLMMRKLEE